MTRLLSAAIYCGRPSCALEVCSGGRFAVWCCFSPVSFCSLEVCSGGVLRCRFAASRNTRISLPYHRRGGVMHRGGLKTHRVPQEGVFGTEYLSRTVEAYFEHRVPLKTRRVPQEPFYGTARRFCTGEAPFRYRIFKLIRVAQFGGC